MNKKLYTSRLLRLQRTISAAFLTGALAVSGLAGCMSDGDSIARRQASQVTESPAPQVKPADAFAEGNVAVDAVEEAAESDDAYVASNKEDAKSAEAPQAESTSPRGILGVASGSGALGARREPNTKTEKKSMARRRPAAKMSRAMGRMASQSADEMYFPPMPSADRDGYVEKESGTPRFKHAGVNPMVDTEQDNLSTFAVDVDTGSYTVARRSMEQGQRPYANAVRVEEWVNYFNYDYEAPSSRVFDVNLDAAPSPLHNDRQMVRIGVRGKDVSKKARKPIHATFLVDVSGSMRSRLADVQNAMNLLVGELDKRDSVAIVTYAGNTGIVLPKTRVTKRNRTKISNAIMNLISGGGTNMDSGMKLAYHEASKNLLPGHVSRVIVLSDGDANIGRSGHREITKSIKGYTLEGVTLSTVGFGRGNYRDHMMEQLANAGNGNYSYIDSPETAKRVFVDKLVGTMQVIAKDVKIQVDFNKDVVDSYRLVGYENRDIADKDFRKDEVDAGEIGAGHTVTALYEVKLKSGDNIESGKVATVRVRHKTPRGYKAKEEAFVLSASDIQKGFDGLKPDAQFAIAVSTAAEIFRGSEHVGNVSLDDVTAWALQSAQGPHREERLEFVTLIEKVKRQQQGVATGPYPYRR